MRRTEFINLMFAQTIAFLILLAGASATFAGEKATEIEKDKYLSTKDDQTLDGKTFRLDAKAIIDAERRQSEKKLLSKIIEMSCGSGDSVLPENKVLCGKNDEEPITPDLKEGSQSMNTLGKALPKLPLKETLRQAQTYRLLGVYGFEGLMRAEIWINGKKRVEVMKDDRFAQFTVIEVTEEGLYLRPSGNENASVVFLRLGSFLR